MWLLSAVKWKIRQQEAECFIFTLQYFCGGGALIKIYALKRWFKITAEGDMNLFFSDGLVEELVEAEE